MGLSTNTYTYSGGSQQFSATFADGYIEQSHVTAYVAGSVDGLGNQVYLNFTWTSESQITVTDNLSVGDEVTVERTVPKDSVLVDLDENGAITREGLSRNNRQALHAVHEVIDGRLENSLITAVNELVARVNEIDASVSDAAGSASVASVAAASALASANEAALVANSAATLLREATITADGTDTYDLTHDLPIGLVFIDGVQQNWDAFVQDQAGKEILFAEGVPEGAQIEVLYSAGTAAYSLRTFETKESLLADAELTYSNTPKGVSLLARLGGATFKVADSDATDHDETTAGGLKLYNHYGDVITQDGRVIRRVAGTVRQTAPDGGWKFINDAGHDPLGVASVAVNGSGELVVTFDFTADKVISFVCGPDDFYAKQGMVIGSSVGFSTATIKGAAPMSGVITSSGVSFVGSLGWSDTSTVTHSAANGTCRIQHNDTYALGASTGQGVSLTAVMDGTDKIAGGGYAMSDVLSDEFTFNRMTPLSGLVFVSGGVVGIDTLCDGVSAVWNGTDNCFDVTVPAGVGGDNYPIIGMTTRDETSAMPYHYAADFISDADLIKVYVYSASTQSHVTTLANDMRFFFMKPSSDAPRPMSNADGMSWQFLRENVELDFSKVFASSGNVWFEGLFEIGKIT